MLKLEIIHVLYQTYQYPYSSENPVGETTEAGSLKLTFQSKISYPHFLG